MSRRQNLLGNSVARRQNFLGENVAPGKKCRCLPCVHFQNGSDRICTYVTKKELPSGLSKNKKDALRRKCRNFVMKGGLLHYHDKRKKVDLQVCFSSS